MPCNDNRDKLDAGQDEQGQHTVVAAADTDIRRKDPQHDERNEEPGDSPLIYQERK